MGSCMSQNENSSRGSDTSSMAAQIEKITAKISKPSLESMIDRLYEEENIKRDDQADSKKVIFKIESELKKNGYLANSNIRFIAIPNK